MILYFLISMLGAGLLFLVQPMAAKVALPILGGSPFVWNSCMVFFQALLLGGYLYAYLLDRTLAVKRQPFVHLPLLVLALCAFPLNFADHMSVDPAQQPLVWLFSMLLMSVGLPFFVLSATSPLSQRWFAAYAPTRQPYVLYAASNLGSFAGLLAYPAVVEPFFPIPNQAHLLFYGFALLVALFGLGAVLIIKAPTPSVALAEQTTTPPAHTSVLYWIALAFVPSSLLYGVTNYITTDIASVPLFWVVPLALYLLTFVLIFGRTSPSLTLWRLMHRIGAPIVVVLALLPLPYPLPVLLLHLLVFFATTMMCHSRLAALKPAPQHLTGFFLWVSFGGVLGGVFNSFVAPFVFTTVIEYPLMLIASLLVVGWKPGNARPSKDDLAKLAIVWLMFVGILWIVSSQDAGLDSSAGINKSVLLASLLAGGLILVTFAYFLHKDRPLLQMLWLVPTLLVLTPLFNRITHDQTAFTGRNLFGVSRIMWAVEKNAWVFRHGTTNHGIQSVDKAINLKPASYYGPLIDLYNVLPKQLHNAPVAVMGMGVGMIACYGHPHQSYDFFEIDPLVDTIAHDTHYFTYLRDCLPEKTITLGDGRISLGRNPDAHYGLIIIDVFTSDAIPMHLMTREAIAMYVKKLQPNGLLAFNISNHHINLLPVLSAIAQENDLGSAWRITKVTATSSPLDMSSEWVVLTKDKASLARLSDNWKPLPEANDKFLWRDDYSNILRIVHF